MNQEIVGEVVEALFRCVTPTVGVAAAVFVFVARLAPKRLAFLAAPLALAAAFAQGNYLREAVQFRLDQEAPLTAGELGKAAWRTSSRPAVTEEDQPAPPEAKYWLPWLAALALLTDLAMGLPRVPVVFGWVVRAAVASLAARLLLPVGMHKPWPWPEAILAALMLALWALPWALAKRQAGGWAALALALALQSAAVVVLMEANWASLADVALLASAALFGVAVAAWGMAETTEACAGAAAVLLPAVVLIGRQQASDDTPMAAFALAAFSPLALTLVLPLWRGLPGRWRALAGVVAVAIPAVTACALAVARSMAQQGR